MGRRTSVLISILTAISLFIQPTFAERTFTPPPGFVSVTDIKRMSLDSLYQTRDELNSLLLRAMNVTKRKAQDEADIEAIIELGKYQTQESMEALLTIFRSEMKRGQLATASPNVFFAAMHVIGVIGTAKPDRYVENFIDMMKEFEGRYNGNEVAQNIIRYADLVLAAMRGRKEVLIDLNDLIQSAEGDSSTHNSKLSRAETILREGLIGQPEVVEALMDMEWRAQLYAASREVPDAIYLIGLPGTGKDTAAEVFTDALHGYRGANKRHMFRLPLMKSKADLWQVSGSSTGYIGSENSPPFLAFLVEHSGGKYKLEKASGSGGKEVFKVVENPAYKGETLEGYSSPNTGVVFVNEFHNWSKQLKDDFLKQALEKGIFTINNPNGGLSEIYVPIRFVIASNEGIRLVTSREANGQRHGKMLSYEQILEKWGRLHHNKKALKAEILATNGSPNVAVSGESAPGISEELLNRIPDRFVMLMRPLSPDSLKQIANIFLVNLKNKISNSPLLNGVELTWTDAVVDLLQEYDYMPEENARPVLSRVEALVEAPLLDAIRTGQFVKGANRVTLDVQVNEDRTRSLVLNFQNGKKTKVITQIMRATLKDVPRPAIADDRIDELATVGEELKQRVFGIDDIADRLGQRVLSVENELTGGSPRPVNVVMLNGLSSTGKTETAKQLSQIVNKTNDELVTFDFSQIQTLHDFKVKILGLKDGLGNPIPSEFMKHYDRNNGRLIVAFDELANVRDADLLKALYDFFREPVMTTFSDGKPRSMGGVFVIVTGNPGQELYKNVPRDIPMEVQMMAWEEISKRTNNDLELQRQVLERYYPEPLITRIGRNNIFFVPPHTYRSLRQLAQLKFADALKRLNSMESRRGWNVVFPSADEYSRFISTIVDEGFSLRYQGASIDSFVRDDVEEPLKYLLLANKVPSGASVVLKYRTSTDNSNEDKPGHVIYDVFVDGQARPLEYKIRRPYRAKEMEKEPNNQIVTAFHEAGHSVVRQALFKEAYSSVKVTVIPGVALIGDQWIYYAGVASSMQEKELATTREWVIRQIAILTAGETAERLVARGETHSTGKQNDMERATRLARDAIIKYGLSDKWGIHSVPAGISIEAYIAGLSDRQKELLETEIQALINEGRKLAEQTLEANFETAFLPLGVELVEKGELDADALSAFYKDRQLVDPTTDRNRLQRSLAHLRTRWRKFNNPRRDPVKVEIDSSIPLPKTIANIEEMAAKRKAEQYASVPLPATLPLGTNAAFEQAQASAEPARATQAPGQGPVDCAARLVSGR